MQQVVPEERTSQSAHPHPDLLNAHLRRHEKRGQVAELATKSQSNSTSSPPPIVSPTAGNSGHEQSPGELKSPTARDWQFSQNQLHDPQTVTAPPVAATAPVSMTQFSNAITLPPPPAQSSDNALLYRPAQPADVIPQHPVSSASILPHHLPPQPFAAAPVLDDDYTWLFHGASLFDLPPDDYLNLHFGGSLGPASPTGFYSQPLDAPTTQSDFPQYTIRDHERLIADCPNLLTGLLKYPAQINQILHQALDYCDIYLPLFHRPTFEISSCPSVLLLALCSLGSFLSGSPELYETGKMLHKYIWGSTVEKALASPRVEMWFLQSLVLIEHICTYTMARQQHEMAEIVHSMIVTLARRNNLLTESFRPESGSRQSLEMKWKDWAQRESIIRIAYTIFSNDVQYSVFFSHHALLSVGMMKLPLPSPSAVWEARTAAEWETQLRQIKKSTRSRYYSLDSAVESVMSMRDPDHKREFMQCFNVSNPLSIHLLIHGIAAAISDSKYRSVASSMTSATESLKVADFDEALRHWRSCFDKLPESDRKSRVSWCAQVMYHFSAVLLRNNLSDIQMAAGSAYSSGRAVTPQCAQAAYSRLVSTDPVSHDSYLHGVEVVSLCLQEADSQTSLNTGTIGFPTTETRPLWQTYGAFLGLLVLWARTLGLEREDGEKKGPASASTILSSNSIPAVAATTLNNMYQRELARAESSRDDGRMLKTELRQLIAIVCDRLTARPWEISHEAARILTSLGEREAPGRQSFSSHNGNHPR
ncbi:hypothetical protein D8B26_007066 [Coccidioides posadasii str. Silveira]|uniref:uncharacterized protein n=1 Tax=Coccidioides posadasii (strain RMSCC 757 / Silveira) TaxID=443226 RepID=UPI001BEE2331|nr:hypothetical protein D8B26_007066 [Coccidioides posadasii str. Silveira]